MFDWLAREGSIVLSWWALVTLAGAAVLPLCVRLFSGLPDRGYTLARAVGLLLVGFAFWLLASLGFLHNTPGNIILSWFIVLGVGLAVYFRGERFNWREWWRENSIVVIVGEVLFIVLLFSWAIFRAHQNNLTGTEKPMELAFMSAVQRSDVFPPNDPWMSGYAISYYYFGYVIEGMLASLSGIRSTVGFNMNIALLFSLTGLTTFGVVYNLVRSRAEFTLEGIRDRLPGQGTAAFVGLLGAVFVILLGNFQAVLIELPYQSQTASPGWLAFWDTQERDVYGGELPAPDAIDQNPLNVRDPQTWSFWWWFRASRIIQDRNLDGTPVGVQPIDEFPQFSFLLADNHPHVLALPFAMLALGLALNVLLTWRNPSRGEVIFYGLCLGGLVFLNTWDGPIYMVVLTAADGLRRLMRSENGRLKISDWLGLGVLAGSLVVVTLVFYLPFFISFRSQAGGVLPNLINPTQFRQYFIMFGPFVLILSAFIGVEAWRAGRRMNYGFGVLTALGVLLALLVVVTAFVIAATAIPALRDGALRFIDEAGGLEAVLPALIQRRIVYGVTSLVLLFGIALVVARLFPALRWGRRKSKTADAEPETVITYPAATGFALLLMGVGLVLTLVPEFLYLRDNFGVRINTIFKFYYQTWLVFGVASAYGLYTI
ncbi:MAG: hypothetical protein H7175_07465, partial [Burkholderiales bacterium]|nr:hypothetical protein [Anaerolineae bacterium]